MQNSQARSRSAVSRSQYKPDRYKKDITVRRRSGSYNYSSSSKAYRDRSKVGRVSYSHLNRGSGYHSRNVKVKGGRYNRYTWAKPEYVQNNYRFVKVVNNNYYIQRDYLIHNDYRWGRSCDYYNGRNWHFYLSLSNHGFSFNVGYGGWKRRYYGDSWDTRFGWSASRYLPQGYYSVGTHYFEPNYAFSFTFNHGYENGYMEGYNRGVSDWNYYRPYNSQYYSVAGYSQQLGPYFEYEDGFSQGYLQGYYAGYSGLQYGWENYGFGDFRDYPVIYDFDYDYYDRQAGYYDQPYEYDDNYYSGNRY